MFEKVETQEKISIHTLTWRVTWQLLKEIDKVRISIHTLTWRVTRGFNGFARTYPISIHTLTWRVTTSRCNTRNLLVYFNPHPHVEGDP